MVSEYQYLGSLVRTTQSVDWGNQTEVLEAYRRNLPTDLWDIAEDVTGKYESRPGFPVKAPSASV